MMSGVKSLLVTLLLALLPACKDSPPLPDGVQKAWEQAKGTVDRLSSSSQEAASDEIEKLFVFEYRVEEIDRQAAGEEIEERLSALGKERWDCFHIEEHGGVLRIFCKRNPKTYLKYIPRLF